jgi:beta-mannosidase
VALVLRIPVLRTPVLGTPDTWVDTDPLPRPADVGASSAYAAVAAARPLVADALRVVATVSAPPRRRLTPLRTWTFTADKAGVDGYLVNVPDCWSRRDPGLADFRGPVRYERWVRGEGPHTRIVFDQLDYVAEILADGNRVGFHEGGFTPVAVDVPAGRDVLVSVNLDDPVEHELFAPTPLLAPKRKIKGVHEWHDSRPGGMQVAPEFDSRWVTRWGSGGITGDVHLWETGDVRIDATFATATPAAVTSAAITSAATVTSAATATSGELRVSWIVTNLRSGTVAATLVAQIDGSAVEAEVALPPGAHRVSIRLDVEGEEAWRIGAGTTYRLASWVVLDGKVSDAQEIPVGFRRIGMETQGPRQFQLSVDGTPSYVRAANYIPGVWPSELTDELLKKDVELATAANLNSLGVHAHVCPRLLPITDETGVAVYQDFPLQWGYDPGGMPLVPGGPDFATASRELTAELVYRLYNHPSVVYWCGHNEPAYQLLEAFEQAQVPELRLLAALMAGYPDEAELDDRRVALLRHVDPTRPATAASGLGASRPDGDHHDYTGSLGGGSATRAPTGSSAFVSEYGAWCANFSAAAEVACAGGDWPPPAGLEREWHRQTHLVPVQISYAGRPERFPDFQTWCFAGQLWSGWHAKVVTEKARLRRFAPSAGARWHFLVDHWGAGGAGVVDRHRTTGPAYRGLAAANRPLVALAPFPEGGRVVAGSAVRLPIVIVNDTHVDRPGLPLRWRLAALDPDDAFLVGRDDPEVPWAMQADGSPPDQVCVLPRRPGRTLVSGEVEVNANAAWSGTVAEVSWTATDGPVALFLDLAGVVGWTSFVVAPDGWAPAPGLRGPTRFRVTGDRDEPLRRRWTGEYVDPAAAPPDQYLFGDVPVDVFDDTHITAAGDVRTNGLPWPVPTVPTVPTMPRTDETVRALGGTR